MECRWNGGGIVAQSTRPFRIRLPTKWQPCIKAVVYARVPRPLLVHARFEFAIRLFSSNKLQFPIVAIKDDGRNRIGKRDSRDSRDLYLLFHGVMRIESREGDLSRGIDLISLTARVLLVDSRDLLNWSRFAFFDSRTALFFPFYDIYMYVYM